MRLIIIRHGETVMNVQHRLQGQLQGELTDKGHLQAKYLGLSLQDEQIDVLYSSDLKRAIDTAEQVSLFHPNVPFYQVKELRERDYGSFNGMDHRKVDWDNLPDDAETQKQLFDRVNMFLHKTIQEHNNDTVVFVAHGRTNRALVAVLRNLDYTVINDMPRWENTGVTIFDVRENTNHEFVINDISHLNREYPTKKEALGWYKEIKTPQNIIDHVLMVNKVAVFLSKQLIKKGLNIDLDLINSASLLHDLDKWLCINDNSISHGYKTEKLLKEKGFPHVGFFARQHRADISPKEYTTWEEKIIGYADRRVLHDKIVSLQERFAYIKERYPPKNVRAHDERVLLNLEMEKEIFLRLDIDPNQIKEKIIQT